MRAYCLSFHANYACRHAGACCKAGWPIAIESDKVYALRTRGLPKSDTLTPVQCGTAHDPHTLIPKTDDGACAFYDAHDGLCAVHRDAGPELLPTACRNFPRVALRDSRGLFITLSHFCPTAAHLLLSNGPISIVDAPDSLSLGGEVEGLDATNVMPPLLRPDMLMDLAGYDAWERAGLAVLNEPARSARSALTVITAATEDACRWSPGRESLSARVCAAFKRARSTLDHQRLQASNVVVDSPLKRFLAAHLFASWAPYRPSASLMAVIESLERALSLTGEHATDHDFIAAVREADLRLRHS